VVIIAGKGHENYQIVGKQKFPFSDQQIALDLLKTKK
jgi:UDP-N-acetylmuramoyl-L-alanyl-D-glutamate--2,6-diaminopimelate ligase